MIVISLGFAGFFPWDKDNMNKTSSLMELQNLSLLENLNLEETLVRDEALYPLAFFRELKCLYLKSESLSDIALRALSSPLPKLQILGFRGAVLTNSGLLLYSPPPMLHLLDLRGCWLLTADIISLFFTHHPQIEIRHEHILSSDKISAIGSSQILKTAQPSQSRPKGTKLLQVQNFVGETLKLLHRAAAHLFKDANHFNFFFNPCHSHNWGSGWWSWCNPVYNILYFTWSLF